MRRPPLDLSIYLVTDTVMCGQFGVVATVSAAAGARSHGGAFARRRRHGQRGSGQPRPSKVMAV